MYDDLLDDPKVQRLPPDLFKAWVNLLCLASRNDGKLPCMEDIAFALRIDEAVADQIIGNLSDRGLLDETDESVTPHNWNSRQFKSDKDETAAERQRAKRERDKAKPDENVTRDKPVTSRPPETEADTDTEAEREKAALAQECEKVSRQKDPDHWKIVQSLLQDHAEDVTDWELEFLHSVKWKPTLTKPQRESLKSIQDKVGGLGAHGIALPVVKRGTPQYDEWIRYYRSIGNMFAERLDVLTVPTEFPPQQEKAA